MCNVILKLNQSAFDHFSLIIYVEEKYLDAHGVPRGYIHSALEAFKNLSMWNTCFSL